MGLTGRKRHGPEEIVVKLRQADEAMANGVTIAEVARSSLSVSEVALCRWRAEYGAADRYAVGRRKELKKEKARLKRLVAEQHLDIQILKEVAEGNSGTTFRWAAASGDRAHDDDCVGLRAACLPNARPAPEQLALLRIQYCDAESRAGPAGGEDAGVSDGEPASWPEVHPCLLRGEGWKIGTRSI